MNIKDKYKAFLFGYYYCWKCFDSWRDYLRIPLESEFAQDAAFLFWELYL